MKLLKSGSFIRGGEAPAEGESFEDIGTIGGVRIERIVSSDKPDTGWQSQAWDEWVMLVSGQAELAWVGAGGETEVARLGAGDWVFIPADTRHRVVATQAGSRWLALHASSDGG